MSTQGQRFNKVRSKLIAMVERGEIPSVSVAVVQNGRILWEEALGWADRDKKVKATINTVYPIASISKSLTATGMMVLVEQKKIDLDDPIEEYIGSSSLTVYEGKASEVTVRRILNMTSGVPHGYMVYEDQHAAPTIQKFINRYGIVVFPPGEIELYSNFSYAVLELIIERVSGKSYRDFMSAEVFDPLGMTQTTVGAPSSLENVATKYKSDNTTVSHNYFVPAAAGGIYSSVHDLIGYGMFHLENNLPDQRSTMRDETLTEMQTKKDKNLQSTVMALGWGSVVLDNGLFWILSDGGIEGATSMLSLVPSANLAVVCLTNVTSRSRITDQIAVEITDNLLPNFFKHVETFMKRYELKNAFKSFGPIPELIGSWEGKIKTHETESQIRMVFRDNGEIHVRLGKQPETILNNTSFGNNELKGDFQATYPVEKGIHDEYAISIHVKVESDRMYGVATTELAASMCPLSPAYIYLDKI